MYLNASSLFFKMLVNGTYFEENGESIQDGYGIDLYQISDPRADESYAVFAVKKYQPFTEHTGNYTEDRFAITKENGCWKICEFNY